MPLYGDFPPNVVELIQMQLSQFGRVGATKIYTHLPLGSTVAASSSSSQVPVQWKDQGTVIAMYGQEAAGTAAAYATTDVRIQIGGSEDIVTNGQTGDFVPLLALFGFTQNWFPLWRRATPGTNWTVQFRNRNAGAAITPSLYFAFIADADLARSFPASR